LPGKCELAVALFEEKGSGVGTCGVSVLPDVAFVGAVFDVVAQRLEHSTGGGYIAAVKNLKANFSVICRAHTMRPQARIMQTTPPEKLQPLCPAIQ
jgi:hypothetical protein